MESDRAEHDPQDPGQPSNVDTDTIDLSRYRTPELVDSIIELISIPNAIRSVFVTLIANDFIWLLLIITVLFLADTDLVSVKAILMLLYGVLAGLVVGVLLGVARVIRKSIGNVGTIISCILGIASTAADDLASVRKGSVRMPTAQELTLAAYEQVVWPTLEQSVSEVYGIFAKPMLWGYRRTIGIGVRRVLKLLKKSSLESDPTTDKSLKESDLESVASQHDKLKHTLEPIQAKVKAGEIAFQRFIVFPLFVLVSVCIVVAALPLFAMYFLM